MNEFSLETLLNIIETDHVQCGEASALASMALAAMDSEPVAWQIHTPETGVTYVETNPQSVENIRNGFGIKVEIAPLYRHAHPAPVVPDGYVMVPKDVSPEQLRAFQLNTKIGAYVTANWSDAYDSLRELWDVAIAHCPKIKTMD